MAAHGLAACLFVFGVALLPVPAAVAAACNVVVALFATGMGLLMATVTGPRLERHARRWHTEPLYRARWENDQ